MSRPLLQRIPVGRRLCRGVAGRVDDVLMTVFLAFVAVVVLWTLVFEDGNSAPTPAQAPSRELPSTHSW